MNPYSQNVRTQPSKVIGKKPRQLRWHHLLLLRILYLLMRVWTRTLRFRFDEVVQAMIDKEHPPLVIVVWHNRLFVVPEFYRRYARNRKLAAIISASSAGAWLSGLFKIMRIKPIRGSRNRRGVQAFREMLKASEEGYDVGVTPDGSRGPMYEMKAGAVNLALRTNTPIVLLSYNFQKAFRLMTWDRFYIPLPFSCVEVQLDLIEKGHESLGETVEQAAETLKKRLDAMTEDPEEDFSGQVI